MGISDLGPVLSFAREIAESLLTERGEVYRVTRTPDGFGGFTEERNLVGTVPVRITPYSVNLGVADASGAVIATTRHYKVYTRLGDNVIPGDHIITDGVRYRLISVLRDSLSVLRVMDSEMIVGE